MEENKTIPQEQANTTDLIDKANEAAERLGRENDRREKLLVREEAMEARRTLGGKSDLQTVPAKVETAKEYADRVMNNKK